jgi:hypothetical protein
MLEQLKYILLGAAIALFIGYLVYAGLHPKPTEEQMEAQYNAEKQADYQSAVDDSITIISNECEPDITSDSCGQAIESCLKFSECLKLVTDYQAKIGTTDRSREVVLAAVRDYTNQRRTKMGLPTLAE